ncbi:hypothetical protein OCOJLMKI_5224 [Methylobacterium iners]|uniref:Tlde1 domain-containing protein n=1 Tax=Methylobacterium iners TaxID=418707 RepID=A0ABQ4S4C9_9HYPH|nr:hypothetical protein OCOJLMKI_5224 [Methylobacterium iners]
MPYVALRSSHCPRHDRRRRRNRAWLAITVAAFSLAGAGLVERRETQRTTVEVSAPPETAVALAAPAAYAWMLDPTPALGSAGSGFNPSAPAEAGFQLAAVAAPPAVSPPAAAQDARPAPQPERVAVAASVPTPLPVPRPPEFRREAGISTPRLAGRSTVPSTQSVFRAARVEEPSLLESIFGKAPGSEALGYAAVDGTSEGIASGRRLDRVPGPASAAGTAIYDITAQRVTLPNGEVLEAHSGLGPSMDNPRHVHLTMRGSTPPGTYDLKEREALFHGVRAIRLNPVGGPAAIHGRVGLLAHTYMLGPSGASNGCVVFRDYNRFLQAYLRGEVRRLVVVAGNGQDGPSWGGRRYGMSGRLAKRG